VRSRPSPQPAGSDPKARSAIAVRRLASQPARRNASAIASPLTGTELLRSARVSAGRRVSPPLAGHRIALTMRPDEAPETRLSAARTERRAPHFLRVCSITGCRRLTDRPGPAPREPSPSLAPVDISRQSATSVFHCDVAASIHATGVRCPMPLAPFSIGTSAEGDRRPWPALGLPRARLERGTDLAPRPPDPGPGAPLRSPTTGFPKSPAGTTGCWPNSSRTSRCSVSISASKSPVSKWVRSICGSPRSTIRRTRQPIPPTICRSRRGRRSPSPAICGCSAGIGCGAAMRSTSPH
jgi:hypothetical protein